MKKKSYNPFKMWGSWVGLIASGFLKTLTITWGQNEPTHFSFNQVSQSFDMNFPIVLLVGFLLGWGIHSLVRYFKK